MSQLWSISIHIFEMFAKEVQFNIIHIIYVFFEILAMVFHKKIHNEILHLDVSKWFK